ncbi:MAG: hypothetical protein ACRES7_09270 [Gammaproteobacteria bacterium]
MKHRLMLPVALGLSDGILNALTLAAGRLSSPTLPMTAGLAVRISIAAGVAGVFMLFVAAYAQLRGELVHDDEQLNVLSPGAWPRPDRGVRCCARPVSWRAYRAVVPL